MQLKLHFSRFEFKYILPAGLRRELEAEFQYFVELDPYVSQRPDHKYFVRSLYYDNESFTNYYEKTDGMMHRQKFRLRTYTDDPQDPVPRFLEIKGRHNNLVFKHRARLGSEVRPLESGDLAHGPITRCVLQTLQEGPILERFRYELDRKRLQPVMLVDYWRRPYISKYDPEFRMTFDERLRGTPTDLLFPAAWEGGRWLLPGYTILEVKFRFHMPKWFHRLIQTMELRRVSISKYCAAVEANRLTARLD